MSVKEDFCVGGRLLMGENGSVEVFRIVLSDRVKYSD